jgi:hypothetical protein
MKKWVYPNIISLTELVQTSTGRQGDVKWLQTAVFLDKTWFAETVFVPCVPVGV